MTYKQSIVFSVVRCRVLQLYNLAMLNWFWPFFAAITLHLMAVMLQFVRLVILQPKSDSTSPKAEH